MRLRSSIYGKLPIVLIISLPILIGGLWWFSPQRIIWQTRRELVQLSGKVSDEAAYRAATVLARDGQLNKALTISQQDIQYSYYKASALTEIAGIYIQLGNNTKGLKLLSQATVSTEIINDSTKNNLALMSIAYIITKLDDSTEGLKLLSQATASAEIIDNLSDKASALRSVALASIQLEDDTEGVKLLSQAVSMANTINNSYNKASALTAIAEVIGKLDDDTEGMKLLSQALSLAERIDDLLPKESELIAIDDIVETQAKSDNWKNANHAIEFCTSDECRVESLTRMLTVWRQYY